MEDPATIQMALIGYEMEKRKIEDRIRELQAQLRGRRGTIPAIPDGADKAPRKRRNLSAAARARIAAAQRKRWAEHRKRMKQGAKTA